MSYKTIVVHVDQSRHAEGRIRLAATLAARQRAHLIGAAMTGISGMIYHGANVDIARTALAPHVDQLLVRASDALDRFDAIAGAVDGLSFERRVVDDDAAAGLAMLARYADAVVISQFDPDDPVARTDPELPAFVMLNSAGPVLIVPFAGVPAAVGDEVLAGWDESIPARRAIGSALPVLKSARKVSLAVFNTGELPRLAGADIALFLARHGVNVEVLRAESQGGVGSALLSLATDRGADLLVMGGYGHTRFREVLLGGPTEAILASMTIPVLMSH